MKSSNVLSIDNKDITTSRVGVTIVADYLVAASVQAVVTGSSPVGVVTLRASNDISFAPNTPINWFDIGTVAVTGVGVFDIPKTDVCYSFIRAEWAYTSGTGNVSVNVKTLGF